MKDKCTCEPFQQCLCQQTHSEVIADIITYMNAVPWSMAVETPTVGRVIGRRRIPAKKNELGKSDIMACYKGKYIAIEIKIGADKQRKEQVEFESKVLKAGGLYWQVEEVEEVIELIKTL